MPRIARAVVEGVPYHVTQRGNRGQEIFFNHYDRQMYLSLLGDYSERHGFEVISYCLMTNHIHLVGIPHSSDSLALVMRPLHMRYSQMINARFGWSGHLFQGRYFSAALDDIHLYAAVRYVERNPVRAGVVEKAEEYPWSSAAFHLGLNEDKLISGQTQWAGAVDDWRKELECPEDESILELIRKRTQRGFPCGDEEFVARISEELGRPLVLRGKGRPRKG